MRWRRKKSVRSLQLRASLSPLTPPNTTNQPNALVHAKPARPATQIKTKKNEHLVCPIQHWFFTKFSLLCTSLQGRIFRQRSRFQPPYFQPSFHSALDSKSGEGLATRDFNEMWLAHVGIITFLLAFILSRAVNHLSAHFGGRNWEEGSCLSQNVPDLQTPFSACAPSPV